MDKNMNILTLAYLGDAIYEIYIREYLINNGIVKVNDLQKTSIKYVSAKGQAEYLKYFIDNNILSDDELEIVFRARNHKGTRHPKNTDIVTYKYATALEAVFGYLYLEKKLERMEELINYIRGD